MEHDLYLDTGSVSLTVKELHFAGRRRNPELLEEEFGFSAATSDSSWSEYWVTEAGWINVTQADGEVYCTGGCSEHTQAVLKCIHLVKHDYMFVNKASVQDLNQTITNGCDYGFTGVTMISSGMKIYESRFALFFSALAAFSDLLQHVNR
ncbi:unnamed protein product [Camellia sinensis]